MLARIYRKSVPPRIRNTVYRLFLKDMLAFWRKLPDAFSDRKLRTAFRPHLAVFRDNIALEVGGPSSIFNDTGILPVYTACRSVDGCNFSSQTVWEGTISDRAYRVAGRETGIRYIGEAGEVAALTAGKRYGAVISSNCLEHVADPVKALLSWREVLAPGGYLLLVVPNKANNFDRFRADTPLRHLLDDAENRTGEDDLTHLEEILEKHDLSKDPAAGDRSAFEKRSRDNPANRCLHHHVFTPHVLAALFGHAGLEILFSGSTRSDHIILGKKK